VKIWPPNRKIHQSENSKYKINKKIILSLSDYGEIVIILRSNIDLKNIQAFTVLYRTEYNGKLYTIRRHCWMENHADFHTHVRVGFGKNVFKTIYPPIALKNKNVKIKKALKWAEEDIKTNWFAYRQHFEKMVKSFTKENASKE
jgi:hypothetical protein